MSTEPKDRAFPDPNVSFQCGLTKREWFAGMAFHAIRVRAEDYSASDVAEVAVAVADAVIAELSKEP